MAEVPLKAFLGLIPDIATMQCTEAGAAGISKLLNCLNFHHLWSFAKKKKKKKKEKSKPFSFAIGKSLPSQAIRSWGTWISS